MCRLLLVVLDFLACEPQSEGIKITLAQLAQRNPHSVAGQVKKVEMGHALIGRHCGRCHNAKKKKGDLDLRSLLPISTQPLSNTEVWRRSLNYLKIPAISPAGS